MWAEGLCAPLRLFRSCTILPAMSRTRFGELIYGKLEERGWTQARLAEAANVNPSLVSKWLSVAPNRSVIPTPSKLKSLAPALEIPYEDLMKACAYLPGTFESSPQRSLPHYEEKLLHRVSQLSNTYFRLPTEAREAWLAASSKLDEAFLMGPHVRHDADQSGLAELMHSSSRDNATDDWHTGGWEYGGHWTSE